MLFMPKKEIDQFFKDDYNVGFTAAVIIFQIVFFIVCSAVTDNVSSYPEKTHNAAAMLIHNIFSTYWY